MTARDDSTRESFNLSLGDDSEGRRQEMRTRALREREGRRKRKGKNVWASKTEDTTAILRRNRGRIHLPSRLRLEPRWYGST